MRVRSTHTVVILEVSKASYDEIAQKLRKADYHHVFMSDGSIDMTGIALQGNSAEQGQEPPNMLLTQKGK